jgi:hypothetical protein
MDANSSLNFDQSICIVCILITPIAVPKPEFVARRPSWYNLEILIIVTVDFLICLTIYLI